MIWLSESQGTWPSHRHWCTKTVRHDTQNRDWYISLWWTHKAFGYKVSHWSTSGCFEGAIKQFRLENKTLNVPNRSHQQKAAFQWDNHWFWNIVAWNGPTTKGLHQKAPSLKMQQPEGHRMIGVESEWNVQLFTFLVTLEHLSFALFRAIEFLIKVCLAERNCSPRRFHYCIDIGN